MNTMEPPVESPLCPKHDRVIEYFCIDDQESICSRCFIMGDHKGHTIESFEEKNKSIIASLENDIETATVVYNKLSKLDKKFVANKLKVEKTNLVENVTQNFCQLRKMLNRREKDMLDEVTVIYDKQLSSLNRLLENAKNDRQKLERSLIESQSLLSHQGLVVDGEQLLKTIGAAQQIPCVVSDVTSHLSWDNSHIADILDAIHSFGTIKGDLEKEIHLKTIQEAPETVEDRDKIFKIPLASQPSYDARSVSSADTGEDVIIESDTESISTTTTVSSFTSNKSSSNKEVIVPQVKGTYKQVTVTHIRSPNNFYVQLLLNTKNLGHMSKNMNVWCRKKSSAQRIPKTIEKGMLVLAIYSEDQQWYRARVLDVDVSDGNGDGEMKVHVLYYDFGNEEKLPVKSLRKMEQRFGQYPPFCVHCSLYDIAPRHDSDEWKNDSIQEFFRMTRNQILLLNVIAMSGLTHEVDLVCPPTEDVLDDQFSSVRDMLIFLELAKFARPSQSILPPGNANKKTVNYYKPTPVANGETIEMTVSEACSPSNFYIMPSGEENLYYLNMMEEMKEVYNNDASGLYMMHCPRKNGVCVVKGPDNKWHRGKIVSEPKHSKVTVFLTDTGNTVVVQHDKIKKLLSDFIKLPSQAIHCKLADVDYTDPALEDWADDTKVWCQSDLKGCHGMARIVRWGVLTEVVLWMGLNSSASSVNSLLVEAGLAVSKGLSSMPVMANQNTALIPSDATTGRNKDGGRRKSSKSNKTASSENTSSQRQRDKSPASNSSNATIVNSPFSSPVTSPSKSSSPSSEMKSPSPKMKSPSPKMKSPSPIKAKTASPSVEKSSSSSLSKSSPSPTTTTTTSVNKSTIDTTTTKSNMEIKEQKAKLKRKSKTRRELRTEEEEEEVAEEREHQKQKASVKLNDYESAAETARKKKVQEEIHKAIGGGGASGGTGGSKTEHGESLYVEITVSCYDSPTHFFIRVQEQEGALLELMQELKQEYKDSVADPEQEWKAEDFCVVRSSGDSRWYRGKIICVESATDVKVELLDYGNTFITSKNDLQPLIRDLGTRLHRAAVRCHLASLMPTGSCDRHKWTKTATEFMENIIKRNKLYIKTEGDPSETGLPIDIIVEEEIPETAFDPVTFTYHSLRQKLVDQGLAMFDKPRKLASSSTSSAGVGGKEESSSSEKESRSREAQSTSSTRPPPGEVNIPSYTIPDLNSQIEVLPTYVDFNGVIYAQHVDWDDKIAHLSQELQRVYKDSKSSVREWALGDVCVAPFVDDGLWYRGLIEEKARNKAKIFYIDFGNSAWVCFDKLREIEAPFAEYHVQVYHCVLEDLAPNTTDGQWPVALLDVIHEMVVNCSCTMIYTGMMDNGHLKIKIQKPDGFDLSSYLVDNSYAVSTMDLKDRFINSRAIGAVLATSGGLCSNPDIGGAGTIFQALATEVELPNIVYVQRMRLEEVGVHDFVRASEIAAINSELDQFEQMMEDIKTTPSSGFIKLPDAGMLCLGKYHFDNSWYRGLIVEKYPEADSCLVIFIDYGTCEIVSRDCLRSLPSQFWDLPSQGIRCHLNLIPPGSPSSLWRKNSLDAMVLALSGKPLMVKVVQALPLTIELFVESENGGLSLAYEDMIQKGLAWLPMQIDANVLMMGRKGTNDVEIEEEEEVDSGVMSAASNIVLGHEDRSVGDDSGGVENLNGIDSGGSMNVSLNMNNSCEVYHIVKEEGSGVGNDDDEEEGEGEGWETASEEEADVSKEV